MQTNVGVNSPQAVQKWAAALAVDYKRMLYFTKFTGTSDNSIIQERVDLQSGAGDNVKFDLSMRLREGMTYGDARLEGREEALKFLQDEVKIDQARKAASGGGRMSQKRTLHDLRAVAKARVSEFSAEWMEEVIFCYLSGVGGGQSVNADRIFNDPGFAGNPIQAPDNAHIAYGGNATGKADLVAEDKMSVDLIERTANKAKTLNARDPNVVGMRPVKYGTEESFIMLMHDDQEYDLRRGADQREWLEITKAAGVRGKDNPIFTGELGKISNVSLHVRPQVRIFNDYGVGGNVSAARALFLGRQAGTCAYGGGSKARMQWQEKLVDYDNEVAIACGMICGVKKTRYIDPTTQVGSDFGVIAVDTAARDPNAA